MLSDWQGERGGKKRGVALLRQGHKKNFWRRKGGGGGEKVVSLLYLGLEEGKKGESSVNADQRLVVDRSARKVTTIALLGEGGGGRERGVLFLRKRGEGGRKNGIGVEEISRPSLCQPERKEASLSRGRERGRDRPRIPSRLTLTWTPMICFGGEKKKEGGGSRHMHALVKKKEKSWRCGGASFRKRKEKGEGDACLARKKGTTEKVAVKQGKACRACSGLSRRGKRKKKGFRPQPALAL